MKNFRYIVRMDGISFSLKYYTSILLLLFLLTTNTVKADSKKSGKEDYILVTGLIRDAHTKKPINAAQITVLNDNSATATTDEKGIFKIKVVSSKALLNVSAFDYNGREFPAQGIDSIVIDLYPTNFSNYYKKIDGINGEISNSMLTNSIKSVNDLSQNTAISPDEILQTEFGGDIRGITRSGVAGMGASLFIRGLNSLNINAQPLFVVDGVIWNNLYDVASIHDGFFSNPLSNINVEDIESITEIKDGTSLYGSKGANGVILINTKRATGMVTKINLNIITGFTDVPKIIPVMGANDYKIYVTDILGTNPLISNDYISQLPFLNENPARSIYKMYHNNTNWANEIYKTGVTQNYSINVKGGDEKALYYFSLGYTGNDGVVKLSNIQRINSRFNADFNLSKLFTLGMNIGFSRIDRKLTDDGINKYTSPTWMNLIKSPFLSPYTFTSLGDKTTEFAYTDILGIGNPSGIINYANNTVKQTSFNVSLKPIIHFSPNFTLSELFDYNLDKTNEDYYRPYYYAAPIFLQGFGYSYNERKSQVMRNNSIFSETRLNFSKKIDKFNYITAFLGTRYISDYYESDYVEGHSSGSNSSINLKGSFKNLFTNGVNNFTKSLSNYLNIDYSFDNRFLLNAILSVDGSSRFGSETKGSFSLFGHKWGVFPAINGAWLISSEKFMKNLKFVNLLKFRVGYGITGNDDIKDYQTKAYFSSIRFSSSANGLILSNIANPQIQWETTGRYNVGMDMNMFNERLSLSVDLYSSKTSNLLVQKELPDVTGLGLYWSNDGELTNKGIEVSANVKMLNLKDVQWELGASIGHYVNQITQLSQDSIVTQVYGGEVVSAIGHSAGEFYGYKTKGVFSTDEEAAAANLKIRNNDGTYSYFGAGDVQFVDKNLDGILNEKDKQIIGNPNPLFYGTFTNKITFKKLTFTALFTYSYGNKVYNYQRSQLEAGLDYSNQSLAMLNRWTANGQLTSQPKAIYGDPMGNSRFSDRWIEDGSYLRLKTLSLSYSIPLKSNFIEGVTVWVSANNLLTFTKYLGADPEFSTQNSVLFQGVDAGLVPLSKSYYFGLKFNL